MMPIARGRALIAALGLAALLLPHAAARAFDVVLSTQGEYMDAYLVNGTPLPPKVVFIDPDPPNPDILGTPPRVGRHVNGKLCFFPRGKGLTGKFVVADDTYREACLDRNPPQARCSVTSRGSRFYTGKDADGWAVFKRNGKWAKRHIHTGWPGFETTPQGTDPGQPPQGNADPQGCVFDAQGNMYGNDVGSGDPSDTNPAHHGTLTVFFRGPQARYDSYCFLDKNLAQAGMPAMDDAGNIYVPETGAAKVWKYSPPFPTSAADCNSVDRLVTTPPTKTIFPTPGVTIPADIVRVPGTDHWYVDSVLFPPVINEYDANGVFVRTIAPPGTVKNPIGMAVGSDGTLYFAELNLNADFSTGCGRVSMVRFVGGMPQPPELLGKNLSFPDGVTVVDSKQLKVNWAKLPPAPEPDPRSCNGEGSPSGAFIDRSAY
ncbi:MAG: hypothetical protein E6J56_23915 [Deltaproteobacteria bacterium]|nr:MAG: hypothetical protein E6J56_23915 [Deltaproteobacteria bacterium]